MPPCSCTIAGRRSASIARAGPWLCDSARRRCAGASPSSGASRSSSSSARARSCIFPCVGDAVAQRLEGADRDAGTACACSCSRSSARRASILFHRPSAQRAMPRSTAVFQRGGPRRRGRAAWAGAREGSPWRRTRRPASAAHVIAAPRLTRKRAMPAGSSRGARRARRDDERIGARALPGRCRSAPLTRQPSPARSASSLVRQAIARAPFLVREHDHAGGLGDALRPGCGPGAALAARIGAATSATAAYRARVRARVPPSRPSPRPHWNHAAVRPGSARLAARARRSRPTPAVEAAGAHDGAATPAP